MNPYLSIVAVSRNDDHGGDPLIRTQIFVNCLARQCERYQLDAELILVDWNPVAGRPGLAAVLSVPDGASRLSVRVVGVSSDIHRGYKYSDKLPLFQMIGKNVGIRRAKGEFILATNIDILFSEELMKFISRRHLDAKKLYRVDRYDIESGLAKDAMLDDALEYAWAHLIRCNHRYGPEDFLDRLYHADRMARTCIPSRDAMASVPQLQAREEDGAWQLRPLRQASLEFLHTNACGDFTLLSRSGWDAIRGYAEFEAYSFNIDSMAIASAHYSGYEEVSLQPPCVCFHIEHSLGSGWTPEGERKLFKRLREGGILNPEWPVLRPLVDEMCAKGVALEFNSPSWGLAAFDLPERKLGDPTPWDPSQGQHVAEALAGCQRVGAIRPEYDLDRLTLLYQRRVDAEKEEKRRRGLFSLDSGGDISTQLFIPDDLGGYSEQNSLFAEVVGGNLSRVGFSVSPLRNRHPLRFDPSDRGALVEVKSLVILDSSDRTVLSRLCGKRLAKVASLGGTARLVRTTPDALVLVATGTDPQLYLSLPHLDLSMLTLWIFEISVLPLPS